MSAKSMHTEGFPWLASMLGTTELWLRAFQHAMVAQGRLPHAKGKGPGSGVEYTPQNVARFVALYVASRSARDIGALIDRVEASF